jgi:two-component system, cell cycle sensor histidine kinase and response regulator CckA
MATVLIVDDTDLVRGFMRAVLENAGYEVLDAATPNTALTTARSHGMVDVLVSDLVMPEMDAFELFGRLRAVYPEVRVLYVSGYADASCEGAFLAKPFTPAALAAAVADVAGVLA